MDGRLGPELRARAVSDMSATKLDVLVVGGGVVGAGAALDAVTRGLSVGLIEMQDWSWGSSSRTSTIINGGLHYLDTLDLGRIRSGLRERGLLFDRVAPHLVRRVPFLFPLRHSAWERVYVGVGMTILDAMGHSLSRVRGLPGHRQLTRRSVRRIAPGLREDLTGAVQYYGAQVDDARYVITLVRTAAAYGALVASRLRAVELIVEGGRVVGVLAENAVTRERHPIRAKVVVVAAGVWTDQIAQLSATGDPATQDVETTAHTTRVNTLPTHTITAHKGVHVVVPRDRIRSSTGVINRSRSGTLLVIPWGRHWIIGTTHTPCDLDQQEPTVSTDDVDRLLSVANEVLGSPLTRDDVQGAYAGYWPQVAPDRRFPLRSGEYQVITPRPGLVLVAGGTFSQYRLIAADAVDGATRQLGGLIAESITEQVPLLGADGYRARWNQRHLLARRARLPVARVEHLLNRYGSMADQLVDLVVDQPGLRSPVLGAEDYLAAEIVYAVTHEGAVDLDDALERRTRIAIETWDHGLRAAPLVAGLMGGLLGWDLAERDRQIRGYLERVQAEV